MAFRGHTPPRAVTQPAFVRTATPVSTATLGYAPYLRPGALLFTLIAFRYLQTGRSNKNKILVDLYGTNGGRKRNLFGENVATVAKRAFGSSVSPKDVLLKHTLFGVYSRALSPPVAAAWSDALVIGSRSHHVRKILRDYNSRTQFHLATQNLRSCSQCVEEDIDLFGYGQWRILHQIPSLLFCPEHGLSLSEEVCGDSTGNLWQYVLPQGKHPHGTHRLSWAASDGHSTYLGLWTQLFDGRLPVLTSHAWATYMDFVVAQIGDLASAQAEIKNAIRRTWSTDSASIESTLGSQIKKGFIHAELSHHSAPARLAQKLIVLGATSALGITLLKSDEASQLRLDLSSEFRNASTLTLRAQLRSFLLDAGLPGWLAPFLLTDQNITEVARAASVHRSCIWRATVGIPDLLLEEIASAREWSRQSWVANERQRRRDKLPPRFS